MKGEILGKDKERCFGHDFTILSTKLADLTLNTCGMLEEMADFGFGLIDVDSCTCDGEWIRRIIWWGKTFLFIGGILALWFGIRFLH